MNTLLGSDQTFWKRAGCDSIAIRKQRLSSSACDCTADP
jgi:hypothetical protein